MTEFHLHRENKIYRKRLKSDINNDYNIAIIMDLIIKEMSTKEKMRAMELLWDDFYSNQPDFKSPYSHEEIMKQREKGIREGADRFVDWEQAKKDIFASTRR